MTPDTPADGEALASSESVFMDAVWDALKADANDLRKQQRILRAFRAALIPRPAEPAQAAQVDVMVNLYVELENLLAVYSEPDKQLCCDGHMCGCHGATEYQQAEHYAKAALDEARDIISAAQEGRE